MSDDSKLLVTEQERVFTAKKMELCYYDGSFTAWYKIFSRGKRLLKKNTLSHVKMYSTGTRKPRAQRAGEIYPRMRLAHRSTNPLHRLTTSRGKRARRLRGTAAAPELSGAALEGP